MMAAQSMPVAHVVSTRVPATAIHQKWNQEEYIHLFSIKEEVPKVTSGRKIILFLKLF